jgi:hypothetical protein
VAQLRHVRTPKHRSRRRTGYGVALQQVVISTCHVRLFAHRWASFPRQSHILRILKTSKGAQSMIVSRFRNCESKKVSAGTHLNRYSSARGDHPSTPRI